MGRGATIFVRARLQMSASLAKWVKPRGGGIDHLLYYFEKNRESFQRKAQFLRSP